MIKQEKEEEYEALEHFEQNQAELKRKIEEQETVLQKQCECLTKSRKKWAKSLEKEIINKTIIKGDGKKQKSTLLYSLSTNENEIFKELIKDTQTWGSHWISLPYTVMTKEFGKVL